MLGFEKSLARANTKVTGNAKEVNTPLSIYTKLRSVGIGDVKWTKGFWYQKFDQCHKVMIPNMWRLLKSPDISHAYANFLIAAGLEEGEHEGPSWHDGDLYKWLEAVACVYAATEDGELDQLMDEVIDVIGKAQRQDGYIHTPAIIEQRHKGSKIRAFQNPNHFETYNFGHLMTAACIHYRATGKTTFLDVARRACDYLHSFHEESAVELAKNAICPSHYMGVMEMYRTTSNPKYLELAQNLVEIRDLVESGTDQNQDRVPFREQTKAVGHAVRANYLYAGVADVCADTGDESLLDALQKIWENVVFQKMYITGACGALYDGASSSGGKVHKEIQLVHQAYGREYQLPNTTAHNESCATVGNALWNWRMLKITGEARFADVLELVLYNGLLSAISLDGKRFFYANILRQVNALPFEMRWSRMREPYIDCFCCPPNIVRTIAKASSYAYSISDEGVWVNLYGGNILTTKLADGSKLGLEQETDYPWDGNVKITVNAPRKSKFVVMLRIPGWTTKATLKVNEQIVQDDLVPGEYVGLNRTWSAGDVIELNMPMEARLIEAHPLVEETRNQVAIKRGPVVYCLESVDLPGGVKVSEVAIPRHIKLEPRFDDNLLSDRIVVLEGKAEVFEEGDWANRLYREIRLRKAEHIDIRLIPYYAWGNRGMSEMTVWMPLR